MSQQPNPEPLQSQGSQIEVIIQEFWEQVQGFATRLKMATAAASGDPNQQPPLPPRTSFITALHNTSSNDEQLNAAKMASLATALEETKKCISEEKQRVQILQEQLAEREQQIASLKTMILRSGRRDEVQHSDSDVTDSFIKLRNDIVSFCKNHVPAGIRCVYREGTSPELGELLMRALVAKELYLGFFHPDTQLFGDMDFMNTGSFRSQSRPSSASKRRELSSYQYLEDIFKSSHKGVTEDEIKEWRIATVKLAMKACPDPDRYVRQQANDIWEQKLHKHSAHFISAKKSQPQAPESLVELCRTAYDVALLFRSSRVDYEWQQVINPVKIADMEVLGTTGVLPSEPHQIKEIIFGGLVRGNRTTGKLRDGEFSLMKPSVVIEAPRKRL